LILRFSLSNTIFNRGFLLANKALYAIKKEGLEPVNADLFHKTFMPILIIGKEHCKEFDKKYPITDAQDLKKVLKMDFNELSLVSKPEITAQESQVKAWQTDDYAAGIIHSKLLFWLPESWVLSHPNESILYQLSRANNVIWLCNRQGKSFSSIAKGLFSRASHFLMSIGVEVGIEQKKVTEQEYCNFVAEQADLIEPFKLLAVLSAQNYLKRLKDSCNWLSVGIGTSVALTIFLAFHIGYLQLRTYWLDQDIAQQQIKEVVSLQNQYKQQSTALFSLEKSLYTNTQSINYWNVLATIMENDGAILRVNYNDEKFEVRVQSSLATDTLQTLGNLPNVDIAEFTTPVRESLGKERFTIGITLNQSEQLDE
jgi:hypothetical protein